MMNKKEKGQFYTTNYKYILQNLYVPKEVSHIIEPFCGKGDLLNFIDTTKYIIECYDIEPKKDFIIKRNTLLNPPSYKNKFVLTNPPFLARNKMKNKTIFIKYKTNDLYKCFISELIENKVIGGIIITPLNFWSSIRKNDIELRKKFLEIYEIIRINIFEEIVFEDTTNTICSFQFSEKKKTKNEIKIIIFPSKKKIVTELNENNNYIIGGEIYKLNDNNKYKISRLTSKNNIKNTNILVKCIDDNENNKINMKFVNDDEIYIDETPNLSSRTYATLVITPEITIEQQKELVKNFNIYINKTRNKYHSLFLTNYRESKKDFARKRISFDLIYKIIGHLLSKMIGT